MPYFCLVMARASGLLITSSVSNSQGSPSSSSTAICSLQSLRHRAIHRNVRSLAVRRLPVITFPDGNRGDSGNRSNRINTRVPPPRTTERLVKIEEKFGIKVDRDPSEYLLADLRCWTWHKWECDPCKFQWKYEYQETCYLLKGKARIYPEGSDDFVEINSGDLVTFPKGLSCVWDVSVGIDKYYRLYTS